MCRVHASNMALTVYHTHAHTVNMIQEAFSYITSCNDGNMTNEISGLFLTFKAH